MVKSKELKILRKRFDKVCKSIDSIDDATLQCDAIPMIQAVVDSLQKKGDLTRSNGNGTDDSDAAAAAAAAADNNNDDCECIRNGNFTTTSLKLQHFCGATESSSPIIERCFALFETNMMRLYQESSWGFHRDEKRLDFFYARARYMVLTSSSHVLGYLQYRICYDDDEDPTRVVVYVYELQIRWQQLGMGTALLQFFERSVVAKHVPDSICGMLTVFKSNVPATKFYATLGYTVDACSPSRYNEPADYEILSKNIVRPS